MVGGLDLVSERARLAKEQADHRGLLNAQLRGSLVPLADLEAVVGGLVDAMRTRLLAVPSRGASLLAASPSQQATLATLTTLIHEAMRDLAETEIVNVVREKAREGASQEMDEAMGPLN